MPKTVNHLFEQICSLENLLGAAHKAALGKRQKPYVDQFRLGLETEVWKLREELLNGTYQPGSYRSFWISEPKRRLISAAPFRDRVVHHALCNVIEPVWERRFVSESFANRLGMGTSKARDHFEAGLKRYPYVLRVDFAKFFPSMDHAVLKAQFRRALRCRRTLSLMDLIVDASNPQEPVAAYFLGDMLWTPFERRHGLPLGNQTSQFFANIYLDPLDHFVKETLRCGHYARYVDDLALFADSKACLRDWRERLDAEASRLRLRLHPGKTRVFRREEGVTFLGVRFFPRGRRLPSANRRRALRRCRRDTGQCLDGRLTEADLNRRMAGWRGHALEAGAVRLVMDFERRMKEWMDAGTKCVPRGAGRRLEQPSQYHALRVPQQESTHEQEQR